MQVNQIKATSVAVFKEEMDKKGNRKLSADVSKKREKILSQGGSGTDSLKSS